MGHGEGRGCLVLTAVTGEKVEAQEESRGSSSWCRCVCTPRHGPGPGAAAVSSLEPGFRLEGASQLRPRRALPATPLSPTDSAVGAPGGPTPALTPWDAAAALALVPALPMTGQEPPASLSLASPPRRVGDGLGGTRLGLALDGSLESGQFENKARPAGRPLAPPVSAGRAGRGFPRGGVQPAV